MIAGDFQPKQLTPILDARRKVTDGGYNRLLMSRNALANYSVTLAALSQGCEIYPIFGVPDERGHPVVNKTEVIEHEGVGAKAFPVGPVHPRRMSSNDSTLNLLHRSSRSCQEAKLDDRRLADLDERTQSCDNLRAQTMPPTAGPTLTLLDLLYSESPKVFAVLDAGRDPRIFELVRHSNLLHESLFDGKEGQALAQVAPYVVELQRDAPLWRELLHAWGQSWGVYFNTLGSLHEVRERIRTNLKMQAPNGSEVYFRFYDPRVLRGFLPVCTPQECAEFFGPVWRFVMEADDPGFAAEFRRTTGRAAQRLIPISSTPA